MPDASKTFQLIVRQRPASGSDLEPLLKTLQSEYGLESYTARQRLTGQGLAMFGKGPLQKTRKIAELIQGYGFACWLIEPPVATLVPDLLRSLEIGAEQINFTCRNSQAQLVRGGRVVAVLADISGELSTRLVKRMLNQQTYRGRVSAEQTSAEERLKFIYQGRPVLDFYILDADSRVRGAVRAVPGKFNHTGLGERAGLSTIRNFDALRGLVEEYAGDFQLHSDFGIGFMPDCQLGNITETTRRLKPATAGPTMSGYRASAKAEVETASKEKPLALGDNLKSLTRYGWLVLQLQGDGRPASPPLPAEAGVMAAASIANPALGALLSQGGAAAEFPGQAELAAGFAELLEEDKNQIIDRGEDAGAAPRGDLPQPPERPEESRTFARVLISLFAVAAGLVFALAGSGERLFPVLTHYGLQTGAFPALASAALFWGGLHFVRLKRRVENTPTSKVRSIAMGLVELHGQARRCYALVSPMTQAACAWYRLRRFRKDKNDRWKLVQEIDSSHVPFLLDDGSGRVTVSPAGASIKAKTRQTGYPGQSSFSFNAFGSSFGEDEKWVEDLIYEGTSIYVLGYAQPLREEAMSLRQRTMLRLRQLKLDPQAMRRYDANGDGQIDPLEWEAARNDAEQEALKDHLAERPGRKRQEEHAIIARPPQRSLPFIIAEAESEAHLSRKYGWISLPLLIAAVASLVLAIYKFLQFMQA